MANIVKSITLGSGIVKSFYGVSFGRAAFARGFYGVHQTMEVYWEPAGYSRPSRDWLSRIWADRASMDGCIRGYMAATRVA